ncbi:MAG: hypothetical protein U0470_13275 [Anaerolineae bacterium]
MGDILLPSEEPVAALGVMTATALVVQGSTATFVDLAPSGAPLTTQSFDLPGTGRAVATDGPRAYIGSDGAAGMATLSVFERDAGGTLQRIQQAEMDVPRLSGLLAAGGRLVINAPDRAGDATADRWRLFDATDVQALRLLGTSPAGATAVDLSATRLLQSDGWGFELWALDGGQRPASLGTWSEGRLPWARLAGEDVDVQQISYGPLGEFYGSWVHRLRRDADGSFRVVRRLTLLRSILWSGGGTLCEARERADWSLLRCYDRAWQSVDVSLAGIAPDGEALARGPCWDATVLLDQVWALCSGTTHRLGGADGPLRSRAVASVADTTMRIRAVGSIVYGVDAGGVRELRLEAGRWEPGLFVSPVARLVDGADRLAALSQSGADVAVTVISATGASNLVLSTRVPGILDGPPPVLDGDRLYLHVQNEGWRVIAGLNAGTPALAATWPRFAPSGFAARAGIAYAAEAATGPLGERQLEVRVEDLRGSEPQPIRSVVVNDDPQLAEPDRALAVVIAGDEVIIDRGDGWLSRLGIRDPADPSVLWPMVFAADALRLQPLGMHHLGVFTGRDTLIIVRIDGAAERPAVAEWQPWNVSPRPSPLQQVGSRLLVGRVEEGVQSDGGAWHYDLTEPLSPTRRARLPLGTSLAPALEIAADGRQILSFAPASDGSLRLVDKWCVGNGLCPAVTERPPLVAIATQGYRYVYAIDADGTLFVLDLTPLGELRWSPEPRRSRVHRFVGLSPGRMLHLGPTLLIAQPSGPPYQLDLFDPAIPRPIGPLAGLPGPVDAMAVHGRTAILASGSALFFVDYERDFAEPIVTSRIDMPGWVRALDVEGDSVFAVLDDAIWVIDFDVLGPPAVRGRHVLDVDIGGEAASAVAFFQDAMYVSRDGGFDVRTRLRPAPPDYVPPTPRPSPTPTPTETPVPSPTATRTQTPAPTLVRPTRLPTDTPGPTSAVTAVETPSPAPSHTRPPGGRTPSPTPTDPPLLPTGSPTTGTPPPPPGGGQADLYVPSVLRRWRLRR